MKETTLSGAVLTLIVRNYSVPPFQKEGLGAV